MQHPGEALANVATWVGARTVWDSGLEKNRAGLSLWPRRNRSVKGPARKGFWWNGLGFPSCIWDREGRIPAVSYCPVP